jgi:GT2 family glycosyltransferase
MDNGDCAASIVIACFTEERWTQLSAAIQSAQAQTMPAEDIVVVVDHNDSLKQKVIERWPSVTVLANEFGRGASGSRNTGVFHITSPIVAFLDDDAVAEPDWLENLVREFRDETVVGVGGAVTAAWETAQPNWFPDEFAWVVGVSYPGLPEQIEEIRNVWAENMAVRRTRFSEVGGFRLNFGKVGTYSSPEDTDLCIRMAAGSGRWLYLPSARVSHHIPDARSTFRYFLRRCFYEGTGKAALATLSAAGALRTERDYTRRVLPRALIRGIRAAVTERRLAPAIRSGVILVGLFTAGAGYVTARVRRASSN